MAALGVPNGVCAGGALHQTGDITRAITNVAYRVATGAVLAIAIYIRDIASPLEWRSSAFGDSRDSCPYHLSSETDYDLE